MAQLQVQLRNARPPRLAAEFGCAAGELIALVGPSGSGKTSLLRAVAGLLPGNTLQGSIHMGDLAWFDSRRRVNLTPQRRAVGLVFQNYALFPHLSAIDNTTIGAGSTSASSQTAAQARQLLDRLGLGALVQRRPAQLSGGQQQRVALARALMRVAPNRSRAGSGNNGVLLLDEPFSAVDAPSRQSLYRELAALRQELSTPIVLVTHDLAEARKLADRVVILDQGETLQSGTPQQVFSSPRNARVAELVGIQNHLHGRFHRQSPGWGRLDWFDAPGGGCVSLQVIDKNRLADGVAVTWVLAGESVDVEPADSSPVNPAGPHNNVPCTLTEVLALGETSLCTLVPRQLPNQRLTLNLSTALLRRMGAQTGSSLVVWIPALGIHIMPVRQQDAG